MGATIREGQNIQGPSVIRVPDWIPAEQRAAPDARYYLYFAHHHGDYIRMAWAARIEGPWRVFHSGPNINPGKRGVLDLGPQDWRHIGNAITIKDHMASPDVHVDDENHRIVMYFHGPTAFRGHYIGQKSFVATAKTGLDFNEGIEPVILGNAYFRVFRHAGQLYALSNGGAFSRAPDPAQPWAMSAGGDPANDLWVRESNPFEADLQRAGHPGRLRHSTVYLLGDTLHVFHTRIADAPEQILQSTVDLGVADYSSWDATFPPRPLLKAELEWEGASLEPEPSEEGEAPGKANQLRDPYLFVDSDGALYLFYAGGGESAIGVARLLPAGTSLTAGYPAVHYTHLDKIAFPGK